MFAKEGIDINYSYHDNGIIIDCFYYKGRNKDRIKFPVRQNVKLLNKVIKLDEYYKVSLLEDLWLDDILHDNKINYIILYEDLYDIDKEIARELRLPFTNDIDINLKSSSFIGNKNFDISYSLIDNNLGKIDGFYIRYKNVIKIGKNFYLLSKEQYKLLEEIDNYRETSDLNAQGVFLAKVKEKAKKAGAKVDDYIKNEEYFFPEALDVDIVKHSDTHLELVPKFDDLDDSTNIELSKKGNISSINSLLVNNKRHRVFIDNRLKNDFNDVSRKRDIKGVQVPKLINNPSAFLPESINLERFSDRVKGLKIRTYKAQPFLHCNKDSNSGWFDFNTGVKIREENLFENEEDNQVIVDEIGVDEYEKLIKQAENNGENYIYGGDRWIRVDVLNGTKFLEANDKLRSKFNGKKVDIKNLTYVLDIYDNIKDLEYSLDVIKIKEDLYNKKLVYYEKPKFLDANLYEYQKAGFMWLKFLRYEKLGGLLADDMGLGKTLQVIAFMAFLKEMGELKPSLIVVPSSLIDNWIHEVCKYTHNMDDIYVHKGPCRIKESNYIESRNITITTYETLVRDQVELGKVNWRLLVIDEAQKIKNSSTLISTAVKGMKCMYRIALTGTPVENNLRELWSIIDFVQPGLLESYSWFRKEFQIPIEKNINDDKLIAEKKEKLISKIEPVFLRRIKEDKLDNLPRKEDKIEWCNLSKEQEILYFKVISEVKSGKAKGRILACIQELIQICSHPRLISKNISVKSSILISECDKLKKTIEILEDIKSLNEKVVIFTKYKVMQEILRKVIYDKFKIWSSCINGEINKNRLEIIRFFESQNGFNVMILSPRAAGVGLNITAANHVIHYTREWNPAIEVQATDRVYRIGQKKDVKVYYPICTSHRGTTVEERLNELLNKKKKLIKEVVIPMEKLKITEKDFIDII